mmetsp:Transcript_1875/g.4035  ORF Transcript_1875/g.4035 Transcript_1875/m.4035 type:complete len:224 (+) Transcript_1875:61-732(+)
MGAGKNKNHRKKRISKHVIEAGERRKKEEVEKQLVSAAEKGTAAPSDDATPANNATPDPAGDSKAMTPTKSSSKTKDPDEASSYIVLWKYDRTNNTKQWKFNKNTQSWLLRHMYDFDKVSKTTFATLVEYLCQGGEGARSRVEEEAKRRARRYKEWEKKQQKGEEGDGSNEAEKVVKSTDKEEEASEDAAWKALDDHEKRKEYKRARKVLDSLKAVREESNKE